MLLSILRKAWIQKLKPNQLLALAGANTDRALAQLVHEIDVRQFQQPERPRVGRVAAAVFDHPWPLFFHVDNDIIFLRAIRTISGRLLTNQHLAIRIRDIQSAFGLGDPIRAQQQQDGSWRNPGDQVFGESDPNLATAFAVLTLSYCQAPKR